MKKYFFILIILNFIFTDNILMARTTKYHFLLDNPNGSAEMAYINIANNQELLEQTELTIANTDKCSFTPNTFKKMFQNFEENTKYQYNHTIFPLKYITPAETYILNSNKKYNQADTKNNLFPNNTQQNRGYKRYIYKIIQLEQNNPVAIVRLVEKHSSTVYDYVFTWTEKTCWKLTEIRELDKYGNYYPYPSQTWLESDLKAFDRRYFVVNREDLRNFSNFQRGLIDKTYNEPECLYAESNFETFFDNFKENSLIQYQNIKFPLEFVTVPEKKIESRQRTYQKNFILENRFGKSNETSERSHLFPNELQRKKENINYFINPIEDDEKKINVKRVQVRLFQENPETCFVETVYHFEYNNCWRLLKITFPDNEKKEPVDLPECAESKYQVLLN